MGYKVGDKILVKNLLKITYPFLKIPGGETAEIEITAPDHIVFRGLELGHLEIVKKAPKKVTKTKVKKKK